MFHKPLPFWGKKVSALLSRLTTSRMFSLASTCGLDRRACTYTRRQVCMYTKWEKQGKAGRSLPGAWPTISFNLSVKITSDRILAFSTCHPRRFFSLVVRKPSVGFFLYENFLLFSILRYTPNVTSSTTPLDSDAFLPFLWNRFPSPSEKNLDPRIVLLQEKRYSVRSVGRYWTARKTHRTRNQHHSRLMYTEKKPTPPVSLSNNPYRASHPTLASPVYILYADVSFIDSRPLARAGERTRERERGCEAHASPGKLPSMGAPWEIFEKH